MLDCYVCLCVFACFCFNVLVDCVCLVLELHVDAHLVFGVGLLALRFSTFLKFPFRQCVGVGLHCLLCGRVVRCCLLMFVLIRVGALLSSTPLIHSSHPLPSPAPLIHCSIAHSLNCSIAHSLNCSIAHPLTQLLAFAYGG